MDTVISIFVRLLEVIFMVGLVGSAIVLVLTSIEDVKSLLPGGEAKKETTSAKQPAQAHLHAGDAVATH